MKIIKLLTACLFVLSACSNPQKDAMEQMLLSSLKSPSSYNFIDFRQSKIETLGRQYEIVIENVTRHVKDEEEHVKYRQKFADEFKDEPSLNSLHEAQERLSKEERKLTFLKESLVQNLQDTGKVILTYYELEYDAQIPTGAIVREVCTAAFNSEGRMTRIKFTKNNSLEFLEDDVAIPDYYNHL